MPQVFDCLSVCVPKCPSSVRVLNCLSAQVSKCLEFPSSQVPFKYPNASSTQVPKCPECWSTYVPFECLECPSAQVPFEWLKCSSTWVPWVPWVPKCLSQSISQWASQSSCLQRWFSKLISNLRAHTLREDIILRLRKLPTVVCLV